jgi:ribosome-associated protein
VARNNPHLVHGEAITLVKALKAAGLAETGGQAKFLVRSGSVSVNDAVETHPGRKLRIGDRIRIAGHVEVIIQP